MMMMAESGHPPPTGWPRACATCGSVPSTIFCRVDSTYLCSSCDARVHAVSLIASRHERVWMCEACGRSPAAFACKADSAILCASCDATIHSANSLAQRHVRVPVPPVPNCNKEEEDHGEDEDVEPWLLLDEARNGSQGLEVDEFLDLGRFMDNPIKIGESDGSDGVVPTMLEGSEESKHEEDRQRFDFGIEHEDIKEESLDYTIPILNHSILMSSLEGGVVPGIAVAAMPYGSGGPPEGIMVDLFAGKHAGLPAQVPPYMDREARVLRYREKRKTRKFEKTIRYASRKAYAEVRPRIKGRFAKSSDSDVEQLFSSASAAAYDIVPSF